MIFSLGELSTGVHNYDDVCSRAQAGIDKEFFLNCSGLTQSETIVPSIPSGAGGAASSALSLGAYVIVIMNTST